MTGNTIKIRANAGGEFDCYLATQATDAMVPAIVLASAVHGVDKDIRDLADEFASHGAIAAAPDLFWRSVPGPLPHEDKRAAERSQPRLEKIRAGEADMADTLAHIRKLPQFNGRAAAMGFCYGGPFAILGPKRLGYDAGISCHGSQMLDYLGELDAGCLRALRGRLGRRWIGSSAACAISSRRSRASEPTRRSAAKRSG